MRRPRGGERRTKLQSASDDATVDLARALGKALRDGRKRRRWTQAQAAEVAGISRAEWSGLELGKRAATFWIFNRAAHAVGGRLKAYVEQTSAADQPRDAVHLRGQELILTTADPGGWRGLAEARIDADPGRTRYADVLLQRERPATPLEVALMELIDWFDDVGATTRAWQRRLATVERQQIARMHGEHGLPTVSGCWVVRATRRNRELIGSHRQFFSTVFPGSGRAWLAALGNAQTPMPAQPALLWISVSGDRLSAGQSAKTTAAR